MSKIIQLRGKIVLIDIIQQYPKDKPIFLSNSKSYYAKDVFFLVKKIQNKILSPCVAIEPTNSLDQILALIALDGFVDRMVLIHDELAEAALNELCVNTKCFQSIKINLTKDLSIQSRVFESKSNLIKNKDNRHKTEWIISTSGTSGKPKLVIHRLKSLINTSKTSNKYDLCWGLAYDAFRFAGLQVLFQALCSQSTLVISGNNKDIKSLSTEFAQHNVSAVSATPSWWRQFLLSPLPSRFNLQRITLGGEIAHQQILDSLSYRFPNAKISHIYASTEAGVGFAVHDQKEGFPKSYLKKCPGSVDLKISEKGVLLVKNSGASSGYIKGPALIDSKGYISTGDIVEIKNERIYFLGRENGSINVGGSKVIPEEVEATILSHPGISACLVRKMQSSILGNLVDAVVVYKGNLDKINLSQSLKKHCKMSLPAYKCPAKVTIVKCLKLNKAGKVDRTQSI